MDILTPDIKDAARARLERDLADDVSLLHFTQEPGRPALPDSLQGFECLFCKDARQLMTEVSALSDKLDLKVFDFTAEDELKKKHRIDKIPATVLIGREDHKVRFFGVPSGYEFLSFLEAVIDVSRGKTSLSAETVAACKGLDRDVHIQIFVTPTCPFCAMAVRMAHQFAVASPRISADMVVTTEFPHLVQRYGVTGVPKTVFNDAEFLEGAVPEDAFLEAVLKVGKNAP